MAEASRTSAIAALRQALPASIALCRQALEASGGDLQDAHAYVVRQLGADYMRHTGVDAAQAAADLHATGHDVERAIARWRRQHPLPPFAAIAKGRPMAAELAAAEPGLQRFAHVLPGAQGEHELRLITHAVRFTETAYGFDYDVALRDPQTRVERLFASGLPALAALLQAHAIDEGMLRSLDAFDSCLLHSAIEAYL
jgi:hypothetical protein